MNDGRVPEDTGLSQAEPQEGLGPTGFDPSREEFAEPDEVVWLRDLDGTGSMHPCTPHCHGAIRYVREG